MMDAITVWQPWATLIVAGVKPYEFRGWSAPIAVRGKRIAIHAGARKVRKAELADLILRLRSDKAWTTCLRLPAALALLEHWHVSPDRLPLSAIVGTATLGKPVRSSEIVGEFGGVINDSDRSAHGVWAWPMLDPKPMEPIIPQKGAQGFFKVAA